MASLADSPSRATKDTTAVSTKTPLVDENDLDPAAFLQSVRELSAKREREDNERFRKLEEEIEKGRQERLARRAEYARSISPEKRDVAARPSSRTSSDMLAHSPRTFTPSATTRTVETPSSKSPPGVEEVPEFAGFGSMKKTSTPATPTKQTPTASPTPAPKPSPSAAMPSRSGTLKWQQRPQSRAGASRPLSMVAAENSAQAKTADVEPSRDQIASALGARDPSWFRQTADRGSGNAAFRKSTDVDTNDVVTTQRRGLPGMMRDIPNESSRTISTSTSASLASFDRSTVPESQTADTSLVESETSTTTSQSDISNRSSASTNTLPGRIARGLDRSPSPTKEMGGFVQSAMMKRSNSINKRSVGQYTGGLDRASSIRSGYGGLQGSHSMPKLDLPKTTVSDATDSLVRPLSSINLADTTTPLGHHSRSKSITSAYTTNNNDNAASLPPSPSKRWSPNKSSWIEKALIAKPDSRPASPTKNSQPAWMSDLAKANAQRASADSESVQGSVPSKGIDPPVVKTPSDSVVRSPVQLPASPKPDLSRKPKPEVKSPKPQFQTGQTLFAEPEKTLTSKQQEEQPLIAEPQKTLSFKQQGEQPLFAELQKTSTSTQQDEQPLFEEPAKTTTSTQQDEPSSSITTSRTKPQPSPKPQIDFRSNLKPRAATEPKPQEQPEFLSRFGTLRKTTTEKYVAPNLLKDNILRGKAGLTTTDGPQKHEIRDEFKESLLAKKDQWTQEKRDGVVHVHKTAAPPATPSKPEALAKREVLGRSATVKAPPSPEKDKATTPEALRRHQTIRQKPAPQPELVSKEETFASKETSKLAARFNPGLASIFARGPSTTTQNNDTRHSPDKLDSLTMDPPRGSVEQLQDMRKGRAKGPKRRKAGASTTTESDVDRTTTFSTEDAFELKQTSPRLGTTTKTSSMTELLDRSPRVAQSTTKPMVSPKPTSFQSNRPSLGWDPAQEEFKGIYSKPDVTHDDDKENNQSADATRGSKPSPIQILSQKDEDAAMRSAKLLASHSPTVRSPGVNGLGISGPPRPAKSSRIVSGQLQEGSLNKVRLPELKVARVIDGPASPVTHTEQRIDARAALESASINTASDGRTIRKTLYRLNAQNRLETVAPQNEYTLSEDGVYLLKHVHMRRNGTTATDMYTWVGRQALFEDVNAMKAASYTISREPPSATTHLLRQGYETRSFLRAIGGILITRARSQAAARSYMLCGRKHLGHIVFDETCCRPASLCSAFVYLTWSPLTIQEGTMYLWKGSACSAEEVGAARLAAMDLTEGGNVTEVDDGMEPTEFWRTFSAWPIREDVYPCPAVLKRKSEAADAFAVRLFKIQRQTIKQGFFTNILSRRPSWGSRSPAPQDEVKFEAKEISPFTQADLEAEGIYLLDCYTQLDVLVGPLSTPKSAGAAMFRQALHFAEDYAELCALERTVRPDVSVVALGTPEHVPHLFRFWEATQGLWGTAGLMAGVPMQAKETRSISLPEALAAVTFPSKEVGG